MFICICFLVETVEVACTIQMLDIILQLYSNVFQEINNLIIKKLTKGCYGLFRTCKIMGAIISTNSFFNCFNCAVIMLIVIYR